jgi:hypothetical protein
MTAWLSFIAAAAGLGVLSLAMQRHDKAWARLAGRPLGRNGKIVLRVIGSACLVGSLVIAINAGTQLGMIYWCGYAMAAILLVTGLHAYAERWAGYAIVLLVALLVATTVVTMPG